MPLFGSLLTFKCMLHECGCYSFKTYYNFDKVVARKFKCMGLFWSTD